MIFLAFLLRVWISSNIFPFHMIKFWLNNLKVFIRIYFSNQCQVFIVFISFKYLSFLFCCLVHKVYWKVQTFFTLCLWFLHWEFKFIWWPDLILIDGLQCLDSLFRIWSLLRNWFVFRRKFVTPKKCFAMRVSFINDWVFRLHCLIPRF